jgi:hypothetical protein
MAEPLERLTAALTNPLRIGRSLASGREDRAPTGRKPEEAQPWHRDGPPVTRLSLVKGADAAPASRAGRDVDPATGSRARPKDSPLLGAGAIIALDVVGWLLISTLARALGSTDPMVTVTIFWIGQFCWGAALAVFFGRQAMRRARSVVIFALGTAFMLTLGCLGVAILWSGGL